MPNVTRSSHHHRDLLMKPLFVSTFSQQRSYLQTQPSGLLTTSRIMAQESWLLLPTAMIHCLPDRHRPATEAAASDNSSCLVSILAAAQRTFLTQLGLALLDGGDHHGARSSRGDPVQATLDAVHSHDVQVLGASVVGAVHDRTAGQTKGDPVLVARGTCTTCRGQTGSTTSYSERADSSDTQCLV